MITVQAKTGAKGERIEKVGEKTYRIYVTVQPEDGKANVAILRLLAKELGIAPSRLVIVRGKTTKTKYIKIL